MSRETRPGQFAVVTVGASHAGTKSTIIADRAELLLNVRTYDPAVRSGVLAAIERIVHGGCVTAGSPREPVIEYYHQSPPTASCAPNRSPCRRTSAGSPTPSPPYTYWNIGCVDAAAYGRAVEQGTTGADIAAIHSPFFAPVIDPTLEAATRAQVVAALAYLGTAG